MAKDPTGLRSTHRKLVPDTETLEQLAGHPVVGKSCEGFILERLLSVLPWRSSASFYRTSAGAEIDLVYLSQP